MNIIFFVLFFFVFFLFLFLFILFYFYYMTIKCSFAYKSLSTEPGTLKVLNLY